MTTACIIMDDMPAKIIPTTPVLPIEIWQIIMLVSPDIYCAMTLTCHSFKINQIIAERKFIRNIIQHGDSKNILPNGRLHSIDDQPAIVDRIGKRHWYKYGLLHRDNDLPAVIWIDGSRLWYKGGKWHRDNDLPAIIWSDGSRSWYINDRLHRDDKPARISADGSKEWYTHGKRVYGK